MVGVILLEQGVLHYTRCALRKCIVAGVHPELQVVVYSMGPPSMFVINLRQSESNASVDEILTRT